MCVGLFLGGVQGIKVLLRVPAMFLQGFCRVLAFQSLLYQEVCRFCLDCVLGLGLKIVDSGVRQWGASRQLLSMRGVFLNHKTQTFTRVS